MAQQQESFLPFSSQQSLSCCLSHVARRSTPKPRGPLYSPSEPRGPFSLLQNHMDLYLSTCFRASWFTPSFGAAWSPPSSPKPCGPPHYYGAAWFLLSMAAGPRFKSQCPSSFAAPFLTPPTVSYTCQHPCILPALLGCHSKSGQVWPHGMEPIISMLSRRPCNQGELLPSPILGGIWSHSPGSKHGHSYLTHP